MTRKLSWLQILFSSDRRRVQRELAAKLVAYYWDGANPVAHSIRDINVSGAYLLTDHRWYPGTVVRVTLQRLDDTEPASKHAITVQAQVIRSDVDGVGLRFLMPDKKGPVHLRSALEHTADRKMISSFLRTLRSADQEGQSLVEFALCLPILLLVVTGIFTFGIAFNNYITLTNSVSSGARLLAIYRGQTTDPCSIVASAVTVGSPYLDPSLMSFSVVLNGTTYTGTSCSSASTTTGAAGNLIHGTPATVTVTYPCVLKVYGANLSPSCTLRAQSTEYVQ